MEQQERSLKERRMGGGRGVIATLASVSIATRALLIGPLFLVAVFAAGATYPLRAQAQTAKIVGLGAASCQRFTDDVSNPAVRRDYLAWAQGFMSGIISSRPSGVDEGLDLAPATLDLLKQLHFLEDHCARNSSLDFSDAVAALYKRLRQEGKT